ncbi:hypothetical protein M406DRAFT_353883 [Cryphonectria parasitica EP155]|uniref:Six-bladed beta-propeller-like protein n=1 Tax=Cryphonectria parasitica (strain ATCC 38755 / EP155) TaxID=660469 RepID=A0A9P4XT96_CRYP1|nr:uncharacterized protein M406DRAFT_353883 [Cryphonectria parasitica EP155]KAF3760360.1 hypothetical protein M406DRAFT_353883 [Cryphonectria parasitica EP155]
MRSQNSLALAAVTLSSLTGSALAQTAKQLFNFTTYVDIENSILRSNGQLLFTTLTGPELYTIDTNADEPTAEVVRYLPGVTALTGIARVDDDKFAVAGGVRGSYSYANETIFTIDFTEATEENPNITVLETVATLPDAIMLNGMAALPSNSHVLVLADSRVGCLWRVDIDTGSVAEAVTSEYFLAPDNATTPIGIDGLKITADGSYAYFTNVYLELLGRIPIADNGSALVATGDAEIVTNFLGDDDWDDFQLNGTIAYGAQDPYYLSSVDLTTGELTVLINDTSIAGGPTSVVLKGDGSTIYLTTRGDSTTEASGQIIEITL